MSKHTPGPWTYSEAFNVPVGPGDLPEKAPTVWLNRDTVMDGIRIQFASSVPRERIFADAALIAAAPDLLEALEGILELATGLVPYDSVCRIIGEKARAAIAKARGEAGVPMSLRLHGTTHDLDDFIAKGASTDEPTS